MAFSSHFVHHTLVHASNLPHTDKSTLPPQATQWGRCGWCSHLALSLNELVKLVGGGGGRGAHQDNALEVAVQTLQLVGDDHREDSTGEVGVSESEG